MQEKTCPTPLAALLHSHVQPSSPLYVIPLSSLAQSLLRCLIQALFAALCNPP